MRRTLAGLIALALAGCAGGSAEFRTTGTAATSGEPGAQRVTLQMKDDLTFVPNVVTAQVGGVTVRLDNVGRVPHDLLFDARGLGASELIRGRRQGELTVRFTTSGTFTFVCTLHPAMVGKVVVRG